jgi:glycosyltransferase involved in cell wall biosynthesis
MENMRLALNMVVRNEANRIRQVLQPIRELLDEIVIVDTGSTDATVSILQDEFGIKPIPFHGDPSDPFNIVPARNHAIKLTSSPWILTLDADELMQTKTFQALADFEPSESISGLFMRWLDYRHVDPFEDYKLFVFRNHIGINFLGRIHAVPQSAIRALGLQMRWFEGTVFHLPEKSKVEHRRHYESQLHRGIAENPEWYRYYWFLGYSLFKQQNYDKARLYLDIPCRARSLQFPVETLNSFMVASSIESIWGNHAGANDLIIRGRAFFRSVEEDSEVPINFRLKEWFGEAAIRSLQGRQIEAYEFAY